MDFFDELDQYEAKLEENISKKIKHFVDKLKEYNQGQLECKDQTAIKSYNIEATLIEVAACKKLLNQIKQTNSRMRTLPASTNRLDEDKLNCKRNYKNLSCFSQSSLFNKPLNYKYLNCEREIKKGLTCKMVNRVLGRMSCSSAQVARKNNELDKEKSEPLKSVNRTFLGSGISNSKLKLIYPGKIEEYQRLGYIKNLPDIIQMKAEYRLSERRLMNFDTIFDQIGSQEKMILPSSHLAIKKESIKKENSLMIPEKIRNMGIEKKMIKNIEKKNTQILYNIDRNVLLDLYNK